MSKYIVHPGTMTVIDAAECLILDIDDLSADERAMLEGDDYYDDALICTLAEQRGSKVVEDPTYSVWCGGSEVNGYYLTRQEAEDLAADYRAEGYDDVAIVDNRDMICDNICPVSEISGHVHHYDNGTHYFVPWSVMGDPRTTVRVCAQCAEHSELQQCDNCGTATSVDNAGLCETCFENMPMGTWQTPGSW